MWHSLDVPSPPLNAPVLAGSQATSPAATSTVVPGLGVVVEPGVGVGEAVRVGLAVGVGIAVLVLVGLVVAVAGIAVDV